MESSAYPSRKVAVKIASDAEPVECKGTYKKTGGGFVLREENVLHLKSNGRLVYLRARVDTLYERVKHDEARPLLKSEEGVYAQLEKRLEERAPIYERIADEIIDTDNLTIEETVGKVIESIKGVV